MLPQSSSYVCDTLPVAKLAVPQQPTETHLEEKLRTSTKPTSTNSLSSTASYVQQHPSRKLCPRHLRMADEGTNLKLQQSLDALPLEEREAVNAIWSNFSWSSHPRRAIILHGLLTMCCFSQLSLLSEQLAHLIRLDPFSVLPLEVALRILGYLDATSLCRAAQVSRLWKSLADDDMLWREICEQHIGQKCRKCGWSLPVLETKRSYRDSPTPNQALKHGSTSCPEERPLKRQRLAVSSNRMPSERDTPTFTEHVHPYDIRPPDPPSICANSSLLSQESRTGGTRPWKSVYSERLTVERNWRRGRCSVRTFKGHTDGVMCLQYREALVAPSFPVLITGSYDRTVRVWNMETGKELHCLKGHARAVRALQFDDCKLITGSMDHTIRVWDWRKGLCIRTLSGHSEGVVCLNYDSNVLASGSVDATIRIWNVRSGGGFTLRGHHDWVNAVQLWDSPGSDPAPGVDEPVIDHPDSPTPGIAVDPGKMLFSASDDGTIRLWDLKLRICVRQFVGHMGQVQSMRVVFAAYTDNEGNKTYPGNQRISQASDDGSPLPQQMELHSTPSSPSHSIRENTMKSIAQHDASQRQGQSATFAQLGILPLPSKKRVPVLISGSLDNTIKLWDIESGKNDQTLFGHIEGVWAVAADNQRIVSGSHDRTIKVWSHEEAKCTATLVGHCAAVTCLALGEDKIVSGSDDGDIKLWDFSEAP
jgi:F-box/WD-40 domain protein MET30